MIYRFGLLSKYFPTTNITHKIDKLEGAKVLFFVKKAPLKHNE
jgi:hypothetical protein